MAGVLLFPPRAGQNVGEWAKQQACRKTALDLRVKILPAFEEWAAKGGDQRLEEREARRTRRIHDGLDVLKQVLEHGAKYWVSIRDFSRTKNLLTPEDERALAPVCQLPNKIPNDRQAACLIRLIDKALDAGWEDGN
jgi:glutathione S-transferase